LREWLDCGWRYGLLPALGLGALFGVGSGLAFADPAGATQAGPGYAALAVLALLALLAGLALVGRAFHPLRTRRAYGLVAAATIFFGLGAGMLVAPLGWLPREWLVLAIGLDLAALGLAIAALDAFDEGETLLPDITHAFLGAGGMALLFGVQVALAMLLGAGAGPPMLALLLATIAAAIAVYALADPLQGLLDRLAFARASRLSQAREQLPPDAPGAGPYG
jgi:hypothetical protein